MHFATKLKKNNTYIFLAGTENHKLAFSSRFDFELRFRRIFLTRSTLTQNNTAFKVRTNLKNEISLPEVKFLKADGIKIRGFGIHRQPPRQILLALPNT
jgi:hypothetical protein